jgi:hypothetical protein
MIVKENIGQFKRTGNSKEALTLGVREINKDNKILTKNMQDALSPFGIEIGGMLTGDGKPSVIPFELSQNDYDRSFLGNPEDLGKMIKDWLGANTFLMFERVRKLTGTNSYSIDVYAGY